MRTDALIKAAIANIRVEPDQRSELFSQALLGHPVEILEERGSWRHCSFDDGSLGWIQQGSLALIFSGNELYMTEETVITRTLISRCQAQPMPGSETLMIITDGSRLIKTGGAGKWAEVLLPDGSKGWLSARICLRAGKLPPPEPAKIKSLAEEYLGLPYAWGGTSSLAVDCSGLVQLIYRLHGVVLPRNSFQQADVGKLIDASGNSNDFQPGDRLFFAEKENIDHVALSAGGAEFIHSSMSNGCVKRESLDPESQLYNGRLATMFRHARRII
ncbi:MAG TPA: NlpC/P60 family protein [Acidobacteriota bacterium]|nr:NlpC/P60 family protein [Acidobacteriota bacterium]